MNTAEFYESIRYKMKKILLSTIIWLAALSCFGQETANKNSVSLHFGITNLARQDLIFSPFIHRDHSYLNVGVDYTRQAKLFQKVCLRYGNFNPMVSNPYDFSEHGDTKMAYPHNFSLFDVDYLIGKRVKESEKSILTVGGLFLMDIQALNFLDDYSYVNGFIIDLRHNKGGDFTYCYSEIGRFTNQPRFVFSSKTKNGPGPDDYTEWYEWYIHPKGEYVDKQIIVLTDRYTISAGERAVIAFKMLSNATLIGDTTNGAHGTMIGRELSNGWFYSLVPQKVAFFDGHSYEGIGLAPDIYSKNLLSEINIGIDETLQTAIDELK